jgi:hypothetical protein
MSDWRLPSFDPSQRNRERNQSNHETHERSADPKVPQNGRQTGRDPNDADNEDDDTRVAGHSVALAIYLKSGEICVILPHNKMFLDILYTK